MLRISWEEGLSVFPRKVYKVVVIRVMASLKRKAPSAGLPSASSLRSETQMEVAALVNAIKDELKNTPLIRTPEFEAAIHDFGSKVKAKDGVGAIAARNAARKAAGLADEAEACDPREVEELAKVLEQLNIEIGDGGEENPDELYGGGIDGGQTGGGSIKDFLKGLRRAVLKCLGRCGRKVGAAGNYVGDFVIGLFDTESVAQRRAARDILAAPSEDVLVQEGAVIAGELAVVGVTVGLSLSLIHI
jgi:hypothetical protein